MYAVDIQYNRRGAVGARLAHNQKDGRSKLLDDKMLERAPPFIKIIIKILIIFVSNRTSTRAQIVTHLSFCHSFLDPAWTTGEAYWTHRERETDHDGR